ncbi:unnamed protein product [Dibothriocephalus latus]|uniref:Uncharacterized protein n=1 Tax=Dibothriocephalus latus TaxID=60516 RepID=A0A3P7M6I9_DIBLA|nr:unnamed protein product [Dibothriocephalus latus]
MRLEKNSIFQLEFVGGKGLTIPNSASANTPSADYPVAFSFDEDDYPMDDDCLPTGLWRLRGQEDKVWQFPRNGPAQMALEKERGTTFEILFLASCQETSESGRNQLNNRGGIVLRSLDGMAVGAKTLGCISTAENHRITESYRPTESEVFHLIPFLNRPSIALYSALAFGFLGPSASRRGDELSLDCANAIAEEWFIRRLHSGACRLYSQMTPKHAAGFNALTVDPANIAIRIQSVL